MQLTLNSRDVEVTEIDYSQSLEDTFIVEAYWLDTHEELTDAELEQLANENEEWLYDKHADYWIGVSEDHSDYHADR